MKPFAILMFVVTALGACAPSPVTDNKKNIVVDGNEYRTGTDNESGRLMVFVGDDWENCGYDDCARTVRMVNNDWRPIDPPRDGGGGEGEGGGDGH